jgi:hypothetical protein
MGWMVAHFGAPSSGGCRTCCTLSSRCDEYVGVFFGGGRRASAWGRGFGPDGGGTIKRLVEDLLCIVTHVGFVKSACGRTAQPATSRTTGCGCGLCWKDTLPDPLYPS